ncbi:unnamed protein product, partial [Prorocentrum cordatum]
MQACLLAQQPSKIASAAARGASRPRLRLLGHDVEPACWSSPRRRRWACAALQKQGGRSSTAAALELNQLYIALSGRSPGGKKLWSSARISGDKSCDPREDPQVSRVASGGSRRLGRPWTGDQETRARKCREDGGGASDPRGGERRTWHPTLRSGLSPPMQGEFE